MRWFISLLVLAGTPWCVGASKPNFVFLLVDDLGWADLGCYGSSFYETPHIDALSRSGMRFTQAYAACPVCSPTRASIVTGRHPVRVGITDWIPGMNPRSTKLIAPEDRHELPLEEVTVAEALKAGGYQTFFAGKWHLGETEEYWPEHQGFDTNIGGCHKGSPPGGYYAPWQNPRLQARQKGEYLTERLTEESVRFLQQRDQTRPFLLYLSYYNVHTPITPYQKRIAHYEEKTKGFAGKTVSIAEHEGRTRLRQDNPAYASMVQAVDDSVGRLLRVLEEQQLADNTVVCFFSDNGGLSTKKSMGPTCNLPLRAGKGWLYEGGIREPMIVRAPGLTVPGSVCTSPVVSMDFFPTLLDLAGITPDPSVALDGRSLRDELAGQPSSSRALYWHYPHYHGSTWKPGAAVRDGDWKLIEFYHDQKVELYNLANDLGERNDLAAHKPDKTQELLDKLHAWQGRLNAQLPQPNPAFEALGSNLER